MSGNPPPETDDMPEHALRLATPAVRASRLADEAKAGRKKVEGSQDPSTEKPSLDAIEAADDLIQDIDPLILAGEPVPERQWLVPGLIPMRAVTLLGGDGGTGKSLIALQLQAACSLGKPWLGQPTTQVQSYGFYAEDDRAELHRRLDAIARHLNVSLEDLDEMMLTARADDNNVLAIFPGGEMRLRPLYAALKTKCLVSGVRLLIIDTVADTFGGNENFRSEVRAFLSLLLGLALEMNGAIVLTAHPSKDGLATGSGISGSTAWHNSVRSRLYLTRPKNSDPEAEPLANERILRCMKSNYGGLAPDLALRWADGVFVALESASGVVKSIENRKVERNFLACLDAITTQGRTVSEHKNASNFAPKLMLTMDEAEGCRLHELNKAMDRLFNAGTISVGEVLRGGDRHPRHGIIRSEKPAAECGMVRDGCS